MADPISISATSSTPIGYITITAQGDWISKVAITTQPPMIASPEPAYPLLMMAIAQINQYFDKKITLFNLPLKPAKTPRGQQLREAIQAVPYGEVAHYGAVARRIDSGPRAIGQACRLNPFPLIIPCHRIIAANQIIGNYSGAQGPITKKWLLNFEAGHEQWK